MGKYQSFRREMKPPKREIHPIWRGIGFVLIVLIPFMAYTAALLVIDENSRRGWFPIPADIVATGSDPLLYVKIFITFLIALVLYIILLFITFLVNKFFGPDRYGPYDLPPVTYKGPRYKR
jgi:hypothetical protein